MKGNLWGLGTDSLVTDSDTVVNGLTYKKIIYYNLSGPEWNLMGFLREDTTSGKAWYFMNIDTNERLIVDMGLTLDDTFMIYSPFLTGAAIVDSVYTISGRKHIRLNIYVEFSNDTKLTFIEGIGTNAGIDYQTDYIDKSAAFLLCSHKNGSKVYQNSYPIFKDLCFYYQTMGINDVNNKSINFKIYPNPLTQNTIITFDNINNKLYRFIIYDIMGRKIRSYFTIDNQIIIYRNVLSNGIYFYKFLKEHELLLSGKLVVTNIF